MFGVSSFSFKAERERKEAEKMQKELGMDNNSDDGLVALIKVGQLANMMQSHHQTP